MPYWINGIRNGVLAPSRMFATEHAADQALQSHLAQARNRGLKVSSSEMAEFLVWVLRNSNGAIVESWWMSEEEHGPAMRAER